MTNRGYREREELPALALELEKAQAIIRYVVSRAVTDYTPWDVVDMVISRVIRDYVKGIEDEDMKTKATLSLATYATLQYRRMQEDLVTLNLAILPYVVKSLDKSAPKRQISNAYATISRYRAVPVNAIYVETAQPLGIYVKDYMARVRTAYENLATSEAKDSYSDRVSLRNVAEMSERYNAKQKELQDLIASGVDLVYISTHANCSKRCQRWQGKLYSLSGKSGSVDGIRYQPLTNATDVFVTTKAGKVYKNGCISGFNCRHTLQPYHKGVKPYAVDKATVDKYREINDNQRALERAVREKKALSIGLKSVDKDASRLYAQEAKAKYQEYIKYSKDNNVAFYPDRCKVFDGEELIEKKYVRLLDAYKKKTH